MPQDNPSGYYRGVKSSLLETRPYGRTRGDHENEFEFAQLAAALAEAEAIKQRAETARIASMRKDPSIAQQPELDERMARRTRAVRMPDAEPSRAPRFDELQLPKGNNNFGFGDTAQRLPYSTDDPAPRPVTLPSRADAPPQKPLLLARNIRSIQPESSLPIAKGIRRYTDGPRIADEHAAQDAKAELQIGADIARDPNFETDLRRRAAEASIDPKVMAAEAQSSARRPITQTAEASLVSGLNRQWTNATKNVSELRRQFSLMENGLQRFDADPNGASQAVLVTFQKILDPESVVRESEYARSPQGLSALQRMQGWAERMSKGGAGVPREQLAEMVETARQFVASAEKDAPVAVRRRLGAVADRYQIPHELVFDVNLGGADTPSSGDARHPSAVDRAEALLKKYGGY